MVNELDANVQSIRGTGKLLMNNGQIKIDNDHIQLGRWSCFGKCDWMASEFSIFGDVEGKAGVIKWRN